MDRRTALWFDAAQRLLLEEEEKRQAEAAESEADKDAPAPLKE